MTHRVLVGSLTALLLTGLIAAAPEKMTFQDAKVRAFDLHRSLIGFAGPAVKEKVAASARAARAYLAKCGASCDLGAFLSGDLRRRFTKAKVEEIQVLEALAFAEALKDMSQTDQLKLQETAQKQGQILQLMSNLSKMAHDTLKAIIQNMRA